MDQQTSEEALLQKHKQEKKDLQAKIQAIKKTVTKGDKKKKKDAHDEITKLEEALAKKHADELQSLQEIALPEIDKAVEKIDELDVEEKSSKLTKAQKRRQKKDQENRERDQRIAEQEIENVNGLRNTETKKINEKLRKRGLMVFEIPSDGDCLYKAVDHGLKKTNMAQGVDTLRQKTSQYIAHNAEEYLPFLTDPATGEVLTEEQFQDYCHKTANSKQWGGHVELDVLARVLKTTLVVVQAEGSDIRIGDSAGGEIVVTYHRHMYQLGEHYNSVQPFVDDEQDI